MTLSLPTFERHASALKVSSVASILFHGALLGALAWTFPHMPEKPLEKSVTIELAQLDSLPLEKPQPPALPEPPTPAEPEPPAPAEPPREAAPPPPEPAPVKAPKPAPKKPAPPKQAQPKPTPTKPQTVAHARLPLSETRPARPAPSASAPPSAPVKEASNPKPSYPELARRRGQEGIARVRCQVDSTGKVTAVSLAQSSGHKLLDDAALKTAAKWRFRPGMSQGAPVAASVIVPVEFRLK